MNMERIYCMQLCTFASGNGALHVPSVMLCGHRYAVGVEALIGRLVEPLMSTRLNRLASCKYSILTWECSIVCTDWQEATLMQPI